jgi:hypothetical protein
MITKRVVQMSLYQERERGIFDFLRVHQRLFKGFEFHLE